MPCTSTLDRQTRKQRVVFIHVNARARCRNAEATLPAIDGLVPLSPAVPLFQGPRHHCRRRRGTLTETLAVMEIQNEVRCHLEGRPGGVIIPRSCSSVTSPENCSRVHWNVVEKRRQRSLDFNEAEVPGGGCTKRSAGTARRRCVRVHKSLHVAQPKWPFLNRTRPAGGCSSIPLRHDTVEALSNSRERLSSTVKPIDH
ncbi:hypothetical protein L1887_59505 [Cichorium endivia]|nr:hypothetical protein L1887_59505 [Cichorium endivia]